MTEPATWSTRPQSLNGRRRRPLPVPSPHYLPTPPSLQSPSINNLSLNVQSTNTLSWNWWTSLSQHPINKHRNPQIPIPKHPFLYKRLFCFLFNKNVPPPARSLKWRWWKTFEHQKSPMTKVGLPTRMCTVKQASVHKWRWLHLVRQGPSKCAVQKEGRQAVWDVRRCAGLPPQAKGAQVQQSS